jgi:hypothetical protein
VKRALTMLTPRRLLVHLYILQFVVRVDFPETELLLVQAEERWRRWMDLYGFMSFVMIYG